jgi:riboflavin kinase/FMN adenylyltransferase
VLVFEGVAQVPSGFGPSAVTIGKFDGVHAGHREVLSRLKATAAARGLQSTVVTFDRNPLSLLNPEKCPDALASNAKKLELLDAAGVDATLVLAFDKAFSEQEPEDFVSSVLVEALRARVVSVGADFRFGVRGTGNVAMLVELGPRYGFEVVQVPEFVVGDGQTGRASSTRVRQLLDAGDVAGAAVPLGRLHSIRSVVVHGERRGRELGYPTANLSPDIEGFIPADGVYAAWAIVDGVRYGAAVSIGNNPTFEGVPDKRVEAHLLDQELDLYDKLLELEFVERVRPMERFDSIDELTAQMRADEQSVRAILGVLASA